MQLRANTWVAERRERVFAFFADAANLQELTPPWLHFRILSASTAPVREGLEIRYWIRLRGIPLRWVSRIQTFDPPRAFVDVQVSGPYRRWIHTHRFFEDRGGTQLVDEVEFDMPFAWLVGGFVARDLRRIFTYRHEALLRRFDQPKPWPPADVTITR
jgi:ligand-binding SRPBCC domain-containing protein